MEQIKSLDSLIAALAASPGPMTRELQKAVARSVVKVQSDAKNKFGVYQDAVGPFEGWLPLAEVTVREKLKAGSPGDDPLIGHYPGKRKNRVYPTPLRNSILVDIKGLVGQVGTNNPLGEYHEYGAHYIPPRPFLRPALYQNSDWIRLQFRDAIQRVLWSTFGVRG